MPTDGELSELNFQPPELDWVDVSSPTQDWGTSTSAAGGSPSIWLDRPDAFNVSTYTAMPVPSPSRPDLSFCACCYGTVDALLAHPCVWRRFLHT